MKLQIAENTWDEFTLNSEIAYKEGKIYEIYESSKSWFAMNCLGKFRVIVEDGEVLKWIYPMMGGGEYAIANKETLEKYKSIISAYNKHNNKTAKSESINLHSTMDAQIWANTFCDIVGREDREIMHSWFANAIMCGYDHQSWKRDKEYIYILQGNGGGIIQVFHYEPSVKDMNQAYENYVKCDKGEGNAEFNCTLHRWARDKGLMTWDGKREVDDSLYNWKSSN